MKIRTMMLLVVALGTGILRAGVTEKDWCRVETPDEWHPGDPLAIKVTLKGTVPPGVELSTHLHWMKKAAYGGFLAWHPNRPAAAGKTVTFNFKPAEKEGLSSIDAVVFLAPGGDFSKQVKNLHVGIACGEPSKSARPASVTFKKSYIWLEEAPQPTRSGEDLTLKIRYRLDAADTWGDQPSKLMCMPLGPWIDNPDGKVNTKRHHVGYPGLGTQVKAVEVGEHVIEFKWKLQKTFRYNGCSFLCKFKTPDGADWPWEWRGGGMKVVKESATFFVEPEALGGLFKYGETPSVRIGWGPKPAAGARTARVTVRDIDGKTVLEKTATVDAAKKSESIRLDGLAVRGTFSVTVDVPEVGSDHCYFGTIPGFTREKGRRTPFGVTNMADEEFIRIASELGFSYTRLFETWKELQPAPKVWNLDGLDAKIKLNNQYGLQPWICLYAPPAWALPDGMWSTGYEPSPFDLGGWRTIIDKLARRYPRQLYGFEMLNEIVPGNKCKDPVREYVDICRTGYEAAKAVDPNLVIQLAGGLWPHNYRVDLLNAGVADWVDVLPVHYSTYEGVIDAKKDLAVRDIRKVRVADNETASGLSTWEMAPGDVLANSVNQCRHVMTRWPDELCAGAHFITYFGGGGDPCGNWSYMIDRKTPRPCAVTLGVVQAKLGYAKPVGKFFAEGLPIQLFERGGKAIAFVCSPGKNGVKLALPAKGRVVVTDYQGNETMAAGGVVTAGDMPVIVEGLDLDAMKLHAALRVGLSELPAAEPQVVVDASGDMPVTVAVRNPYADARTFEIAPEPAQWGAAEPLSVTLKPGETKAFELHFKPKPGVKVPALSRLAATVSTRGVSAVRKPFLLYAIDPSAIGNLIVNGDFESESAAPWGGKNAIVEAPNGTGRALLLEGTGKGQYKSQWQSVTLPVPGQSYLYTCWMRGEEMGGGSNIGESFSDGSKSRDYYMPAVFSMGDRGSDGWRFMVKRFDSHANTKALSLAPVAAGTGKVYVDNVSLSLYRDTDFAAFAGRTGGERASSWIPLLCDNQVTAQGGYKWSERSLAGIAAFGWDDTGLSLRCEVTDDVSAPKAITSSTSVAGEEALAGDMLALSIFPKMGADGRPETAQLRWYMNLASPGGGSGATTLFRPAKYSLGLKSGQLAKDSSVYQVNFRRVGGKTVYELKIPWAEIPGFAPAKGASFGCNLVLIDSDGGAGLGKMIWGADLGDTPSGCGVVTLLP